MFLCVESLLGGYHLKKLIKKDIKYWKRKIPQFMCEMQKRLPSKNFNAQEDTSYIKLRRLNCVDLYKLGQYGWFRDT